MSRRWSLTVKIGFGLGQTAALACLTECFGGPTVTKTDWEPRPPPRRRRDPAVVDDYHPNRVLSALIDNRGRGVWFGTWGGGGQFVRWQIQVGILFGKRGTGGCRRSQYRAREKRCRLVRNQQGVVEVRWNELGAFRSGRWVGFRKYPRLGRRPAWDDMGRRPRRHNTHCP